MQSFFAYLAGKAIFRRRARANRRGILDAMNREHGYTLMETLVTLTLMMILSVGGLYGWQRWQQQQRLWQTAVQVRDFLLFLRDDANAYNRDRVLRVGQDEVGWCLSAEGEGPDCASGTSFTLRPRWPGITLAGDHAGWRYAWSGVLWSAQHRLGGESAAAERGRQLEHCDLTLGADSFMPQRQRRRVSVSRRGFSLAEALIAMAIGSLLLMGACRFLPALQRHILRQGEQLALENELWQRVHAVGKHLQRAGYCRGACGGAGLELAAGGECLIVRWDANSNGRWETSPAAAAESTGFRLHDGALETLRGASDCRGGGWEKITNPAAIVVTRFSVQRQVTPGFAPELSVTLAARSAQQTGLTSEVEQRVTGYNL